MATTLYKGYVIISFTRCDDATGMWRLTVDISWDFANQRGHQMLIGPSDFKTREGADQYGLDLGKKWVEERLMSAN